MTNDAVALATSELFRDVPAEIVDQVLAECALRQLARGDVLLSPTASNEHVYLLLSGSLGLHFESPTAPEVRTLGPGVAVGEMSVIDDAPPSAYVIAKEASRVLPIHRQVIDRLVTAGNPLARNLLRLMAGWIKANTRRIATDQSQVERLTATIRRVTAQGLDQRVPYRPETREFAQLIHVFNEMLERLERSFCQASRFSADAAHELKTPLAILQGRIEQAIHHEEAASPAQAMLADILDEVRRLSAITRKLLLLAQADAGRLRLNLAPFDLSAALAEQLEDIQLLAPDLPVTARIAAALIFPADADLMGQLLRNLVGNAVKYNRADGWLAIEAWRQDGGIALRVANAATEAIDGTRIFERFYRSDDARGRRIEGSGLGLSLAREIARAHGGELKLAATPAGEVGFVLSLPG